MTYRPFDLTGKVALVTGGDGGIGLRMAEALAGAGSDVIGRDQHQSQPAFRRAASRFRAGSATLLHTRSKKHQTPIDRFNGH